MFFAPCLTQASINAFMFDGLFALPRGIVAERFPVNHKYTSLFSGEARLIKFPLIKARYAVASDRLGDTLPLWHPLPEQLLANIGTMVLEKCTVSVMAGELSTTTVVVLEQPDMVNINAIPSNNPIPIFNFDMIFVFFKLLKEQPTTIS